MAWNNNKGNQNRNNNNNSSNNNNNFNNNSNNRGRGGRNGGRGGGATQFGRGGARGGGGGRSALTMCRNFTTTGSCAHGSKCRFSHGLRLHATIPAAKPQPHQPQNNNNYHNNNNQQNNTTAVSSIDIWEQPGGGFKIFTASHDGFWRLWNTAQGQFTQEFEHNMHGPVHSCLVGGSYLVCGFECPPAGGSTVPVGHAHVWNLQTPQQPPLELHMQTPLLNYAHNSGVTALILLPPDTVVTGAKDGSIRLWKFAGSQVELTASLPGHARQVTALLDGGSDSLWSAGLDHCIRIWDMATKTMRYCIATHTSAVTGLLRYQLPGADTFILSSSLDQTVKVWNLATGECVASETCGTEGNGIVSMCLVQDTAQMDLLLLGMEHGSIQCRSVVGGPGLSALQSVFQLHNATGVSHQGAVQCLTAGPSATFYSGGGDGNMLVLSFTGSIQELLQQQQSSGGGGGQRH